MDDVSPQKTGALPRLAVLLALVTSAALATWLTPLGGYLSRDGVGEAIVWLRGSSSAPLAYMVVYAAATALAIPGSILTLVGGATFGVFWGTLYTTVGANVGANLAFLIGRALGRDGVERLARGRLQALDRATVNHGFRGLLTLRLIPAVPFNALNFGSGLTAIRWPTYALATLVGIFPGTLVYTMFADALLAGSLEASRQALLRVLATGVLLVLLTFLPTLTRRLGGKVPGASVAPPLMIAAALALATVGPRGEAAAQALPSHEAFSEVLASVVERPRVDYARLKETRAGLDAYLATLADVPAGALESTSEEARLAFWINAYNACMLRLVVDHYPIRKDERLFARVRNAVAGRPDNSVWQIEAVFTRADCRVAGADRSQDEIEHEIIRPMGDPRIHFALNCAARSCPPLWPEAYTPEALDRQLDRAVSSLLTDDAHFRVEENGRERTARLNKVLDWYRDDFGGIEGLKAFLAPYVAPDVAEVLRRGATRVEFFDYDWTLNDTRR